MDKEYFAHETAIVDAPCKIGKGTKNLAFLAHYAELRFGQKL